MDMKQWWVFTFGYGQTHQGCYVMIYGTYSEARARMFDKYGREWCGQYTEEQWKKWLDEKPSWVSTEKELARYE